VRRARISSLRVVRARPPVEVVLPIAYYAVLLAELAGLIGLSRTRGFSAGDALGHGIGWAGTASMVLMHVYSLRRRVRALSSWGPIRAWLHVHIFLGLQGALLVTFHSLHLHSFVNLSGLTFGMTLLVVASGLFGRYLFSLLPKGVSGDRLSKQQIEAEIEALRGEEDQHQALRDAVRRREYLLKRLATLEKAERLFRNWTILHKPLTFVLLGTVVLHVYAHYVYAAQFSG